MSYWNPTQHERELEAAEIDIQHARAMEDAFVDVVRGATVALHKAADVDSMPLVGPFVEDLAIFLREWLGDNGPAYHAKEHARSIGGDGDIPDPAPPTSRAMARFEKACAELPRFAVATGARS